MSAITLYNYSWHIIIVQNPVFCEIKKMLFVTPPSSMPHRSFISASFCHVMTHAQHDAIMIMRSTYNYLSILKSSSIQRASHIPPPVQ